jgi:hypothetical protein
MAIAKCFQIFMKVRLNTAKRFHDSFRAHSKAQKEVAAQSMKLLWEWDLGHIPVYE